MPHISPIGRTQSSTLILMTQWMFQLRVWLHTYIHESTFIALDHQIDPHRMHVVSRIHNLMQPHYHHT